MKLKLSLFVSTMTPPPNQQKSNAFLQALQASSGFTSVKRINEWVRTIGGNDSDRRKFKYSENTLYQDHSVYDKS